MANDDSEPGLDRGMLAKAELELSDRIEEEGLEAPKVHSGVFVAGLTGFGVLGATVRQSPTLANEAGEAA